MTSELVCSQHGPYDASYGTCPYCSGAINRPPAPTPLDEDDMPTDLGHGGGPAPEYGQSPAPSWEDEAPTELSPGRRGGRGFLDEDEETELGRMRRDLDVTELDVVETGALAILWVKDGLRRGRIYKITNGAVVGRSEGDLILDDSKVSNPHAKFTVEDEAFVLWDFGSSNGTFVNGDRIRAATTLNENDEIKMGDTVFVLKILDSG